MFKLLPIFCILVIMSGNANASDPVVEMSVPKVIITDVPVEIKLTIEGLESDTTLAIQGFYVKSADRTTVLKSVDIINGKAIIKNAIFPQSGTVTIQVPGLRWQGAVRVLPGWISLLPPLIAILLALIARQVLVALFVGIWVGAAVIYGYNPFMGMLMALTEYIALAPADPEKMAIVIFTLTLGGMIGVISKMGGTQGIVEALAKHASDSRRGQLVTWMMGVLIFFDDYANTLIVGSTMRPLTDKLKISREKLSYLVDSTAAPVANIAIISTWIGFEVSLIGASFIALGISDNAYITFIKTIPYNFYAIFALAIGLSIAWFGRDFGPMLRAERRAFTKGELLAPDATPISSLDSAEITAVEGIPLRWYNGFVPIMAVIVATLAGLWYTGISAVSAAGTDTSSMGFIRYMSTVVGSSDSYAVLMWASFAGSLTAILLATGQKILKLEEVMLAWIGGTKAMLLAVLILTMAWSIGNICSDLRTADFVIGITEGLLSAHLVPVLSFFIAALISFATGTSFGVMAILMPIVIPMGYLLPQADPSIAIDTQQAIFLSTIASVLAGATFGDHCSPISDTTILSSMASGSDHIDHVKTQFPYAFLGGILAMSVGFIPVGFGVSPYIMLPVGLIIVLLIIRFYGKPARA